MTVSRTLRNGGMALDHADAVPVCTQLIRGGDAGDSAADDDDIHDSFSPEGARPDWFTSGRPNMTGRPGFAGILVREANRRFTTTTPVEESAP
jgi:hypothetical protein